MLAPIPIKSVEHLADLLGMDESHLLSIQRRSGRQYRRFKIPKATGGQFRIIHAPRPELRGVQRWIMHMVLRPVQPHPCSTGFAPGCSTLKNALPHVDQSFLLSLDLEDFFPTITRKRVFGLFRGMGYCIEVAVALARLCTFKNHLPQGAPTSPDIANLICRHLDRRLSAYAMCREWNYTRYADDISISGTHGVSPVAFGNLVRIIQDEGFDLNERKARIRRRNASQQVTGVVVNEKPAAPRVRRRYARAILHRAAMGLTVEDSAVQWAHGFMAYASQFTAKG